MLHAQSACRSVVSQILTFRARLSTLACQQVPCWLTGSARQPSASGETRLRPVPAEIIRHPVWLYHVYSLSLRDVELEYAGDALPCRLAKQCWPKPLHRHQLKWPERDCRRHQTVTRADPFAALYDDLHWSRVVLPCAISIAR